MNNSITFRCVVAAALALSVAAAATLAAQAAYATDDVSCAGADSVSAGAGGVCLLQQGTIAYSLQSPAGAPAPQPTWYFAPAASAGSASAPPATMRIGAAGTVNLPASSSGSAYWVTLKCEGREGKRQQKISITPRQTAGVKLACPAGAGA